MSAPSAQLVRSIRQSSRDLIREFGFLNRTIAGTDLSPSAVYALIEIGQAGSLPAKALAAKLLLEKSTISRLVTSLARQGEIEQTQSAQDARQKDLKLTDQGQATLARIDRYAEDQVICALTPLADNAAQEILSGVQGYADALETARGAPQTPEPPQIHIGQGYAPGLVGRIALMHGRYYNRLVGFGVEFETKVASELSEFLHRLGHEKNQIWYAEQAGEIIGSVTIDGEDLGGNKGHLRWFILDDGLRGSGIGARLLQEAMTFCDQAGFSETHLWTFVGLDAARTLYERNGFVLAEQQSGKQWGTEVQEQRFVRAK